LPKAVNLDAAGACGLERGRYRAPSPNSADNCGTLVVTYGDGTGAFPRSRSVPVARDGIVVANIAEQYRTARPGTATNDTTILPDRFR
jgi:hypothetical protein